MRRYYKKRRSKSNEISSLDIILAIIILAVSIAIIRGIVLLFTTYIGIVITILVIGLVVASLYFANIFFNNKYTDLILENSVFINELNELNQIYKFLDIDDPDLINTYDNKNFFDDISEKDYLIYNLVHSKNKVLKAITDAKINAELYEIYLPKIQAIKEQMKANTQYDVFFIKKYQILEEALFDDITIRPTTHFQIKVCLTLTNIHGQYITNKIDVFSAKEIEELINRLNDTENGFYTDNEIWQSICRVERGKVTNKIRFAIYKRDNNRCRHCGSAYNLEVDHIFPIAKGGKTTFDNLQTLCHNCNAKKSDSLTIEQKQEYYFKKQNLFCPYCRGLLVKKQGKNGFFYGCSNYPNCKFTKSL